MNVLNLRKEVLTFLKTIHARTYYERAPDNATFPYIVFNLTDSIELEGNREDFDLDVDIWGLDSNTVEIETITGDIDGDGSVTAPSGLHRKLIFSENQSFKIYRDRRLNLTDKDDRIRRRKLIYKIQTYL